MRWPHGQSVAKQYIPRKSLKRNERVVTEFHINEVTSKGWFDKAIDRHE